eukprot:4089357-Amphidinium_carterae.1
METYEIVQAAKHIITLNALLIHSPSNPRDQLAKFDGEGLLLGRRYPVERRPPWNNYTQTSLNVDVFFFLKLNAMILASDCVDSVLKNVSHGVDAASDGGER